MFIETRNLRGERSLTQMSTYSTVLFIHSSKTVTLWKNNSIFWEVAQD